MDVFGSDLFASPLDRLRASATAVPSTWRDMNETLEEEQRRSLLANLGLTALSGANYVGEKLDQGTGSRALRGLLGGEFRELLSLFPFSDEVGLTDRADLVSGKDLASQYLGIRDNPNAWSDDIAGFGIEALLDPTLPLTFGTGAAVSGAGKLAKAAGVLGDATAAAAAKAGVQIGAKNAPGTMASRVGLTLQDLLDYAPNNVTVRQRLADTAARQGLDFDAIRAKKESLSGLLGVGVPFRDASFVVGSGPTGQKIAGAIDKVGSLAYNVPYSPLPVLRGLFDASAKGSNDPFVQELASASTRGEEAGRFDVRFRIGGLKQALDKTGWLNSGDRAADTQNLLDLRRYLEGVPTRNPLPPEVAQVADQIKALGPEIRNAETGMGLKSAELTDKYVGYVPRVRRTFADEPPQRSSGSRVVDTTSEFQNQREDFLRNLPGGTALLDEIAMDDSISAMLRVDDYRNNTLPQPVRDAVKQKLIQKYGPELGDLHTNPDRQGEFRQFVDWVTKLDPRYARDKTTYFADPLEGYLSRLETGSRAINNGGLIRDILSGAAYRSDSRIFQKPTQTLGKAIQAMGGLDYTPFAKNVEQGLLDRFTRSKDPADLQAFLQDQIDARANVSDATANTFAFQQAVAQKLPWQQTFDQQGNVIGPITPEIQALIDQSKETQYASDLLNRYVADTKITDDATQMLGRFMSPPAVGKAEDAARKATNLFKFGVTSLFPSFHVRNLGSGQFNNVIAGAYSNPMEAGQALREAHALMGGGTLKGIADRYRSLVGPTATDEQAIDHLRQLVFAANLVEPKAAQQLDGAGGTESLRMLGSDDPLTPFGGFKSQEGISALQAINPLNVRGMRTNEDLFYPARAMNQFGSYVEGQNRIAPFLGLLRQGIDPQEAMRRVKTAQVDYSRATDFERKYLSLLFPFYKFTRGQLPFVAEQLSADPSGLLAQAVRGQSRTQRDNEFVPESVSRTTAIPLGGDDGNNRYLTGFGLGFEDPLSLVAPGTDPFRFVQNTTQQLMGRLNPLLKAPIEIAAGTQFFSGRDIEDLDSGVGRIISNVGLAEEPPPVPLLLDQALANSPLARLLSTTRQVTDQRKWDYALPLNLLSGVKITDVPAEKSASVAQRLAIEDLLKGQPGVYSSKPQLFVSPEEYALMTPMQQQTYLLYRELQAQARGN